MKLLKKHARPIVATLAAVVLVGLAAVCTVWLLNMNDGDLNSPEKVINRVGRHVQLPVDEKPALLTVTDPSKITSDFLKSAQIGDKVLVYQNNKKVIIYRPSIDKIIDIGPVVIDVPKTADSK